MNVFENLGEEKANVRDFCEKLREEILNSKVDLVAEVKCPDGQYRNRPLLDVATVLEIMGNVLEKEMSRWNSHFKEREVNLYEERRF